MKHRELMFLFVVCYTSAQMFVWLVFQALNPTESLNGFWTRRTGEMRAGEVLRVADDHPVAHLRAPKLGHWTTCRLNGT